MPRTSRPSRLLAQRVLFRLHAVAHVVVTPLSHLMQAAMHCSRSLGLYEGKFSVTHLEAEGSGSGEQPAIDSSVTSPIAAMKSRSLIRLSVKGTEFGK